MTDKEIEEWKVVIDKMSHREMAILYRFASTGHPCFDGSLPLYAYFKKRFDSLGGMTTNLSKSIGWDEINTKKKGR